MSTENRESTASQLRNLRTRAEAVAKHTPGPWRFFQYTSGAVEVGTNQRKIAVMPWCEAPCVVDPEDEANARAIAAVPELIDALENINDALVKAFNGANDLYEGKPDEFIDELIGIASEALAKAGL